MDVCVRSPSSETADSQTRYAVLGASAPSEAVEPSLVEPTGAQTVGTPKSTSPYETWTLAGIEERQASPAPKAATDVVRRSAILSACCTGICTGAARGGTPPARNVEQLTDWELTAALTWRSAW